MLGDLAESVANKLTADFSAPVQEAAAITEEAALQAENSLFTKIRFSWKPEDRAILERIRMASDAMFQEAFAASIVIIDEFYTRLRIPEQRLVGGHMVVVKGSDGRPVWKKDETGHIIEDWEQLTGEGIEYTLASLHRLKMAVAPQVNQLFLEAVYARHIASDIYDDTWTSMMDGTQGDRAARSNRESRQSRYAAFFRFYLHSVADTFMQEIDSFMRTLTNIRAWQVRSQKG